MKMFYDMKIKNNVLQKMIMDLVSKESGDAQKPLEEGNESTLNSHVSKINIQIMALSDFMLLF